MEEKKSVFKNKIVWIVLACLLIAILATAVAFSGRIVNFMSKPDKTIDVTAGKSKTVKNKTTEKKDAKSSESGSAATASGGTSTPARPDESGYTDYEEEEQGRSHHDSTQEQHDQHRPERRWRI